MGSDHHVARQIKNRLATKTWVVVLEYPVTDDSITLEAKKGKVGPASSVVKLDDQRDKAVEIAPIFDTESYTLMQRRGKVSHKVMGKIVAKSMSWKTPGPPSTDAQNPDPNEVKRKLDRAKAPVAKDELLREDVSDFGKVPIEELKKP
jgi:hypothetical protein